jgi:asparagine synthetase B (glutamine-hydrolysing)
MIEGVQSLPGASVSISDGNSIETRLWFDWGDCDRLGQLDPEDRFQEIFDSWVAENLPGNEAVGLLLSGGTDSALLAALLKPLLGDRLICITQDFFAARYSERAAAAETARKLDLPLIAALIGRSDHYEACLKLNGRVQDSPVHGLQAANLCCLAAFARERGINTLITGEHADSLFLGFGHYFHDFPAATEDYLTATALLAPELKLRYLASKSTEPSALSSELLACLGVPRDEYARATGAALDVRRRTFEPLVSRLSLANLQQLGGQIDGGVGWREMCLAVMRAVPGCRVLCPFYDSEMIRFALRLPPEWLYRDGQTKYFLRHLLRKRAGLDRAKRPAALSPLRFWRLLPSLAEYAGMCADLRPLFHRISVRNAARFGALYNDVAMIASLAVWMKSHGLNVRVP